MSNNVVSISNIINVTLTAVPTGISVKNVNEVALFTTESPSNSDVYRAYRSASEVANDYGTSSVTSAMANNVFAQAPNLLTGGGELIIFPMQSSVSATQGDWETDDISANLAGLITVTDGDITVELNGTDINLTGLDFTTATTFDDIAQIIGDKEDMKDCIVEAVSTTGLKFTSKKVGLDSDVIVKQYVAGVGTDLSGASYFDTANGTATSGANASGETLVDAIDRVKDSIFFCGVMTNLEMEDSVIETTATAIQSQDRIFVHHFSDTNDQDGVISTIQQASQTQTRCLLYTESPSEANLMKASYVGRAFSVNFAGSNTSQTMHLKTLANVTPDPKVNQTIYNKADDVGSDMYVSYDGDPATFSTGGNDYFDQVYSRLQLKFSLEAAGYNYLKGTSTKVPQTEEGITGLKGAYAGVLSQFVRNGYIGVGLIWNSSESFGDPEDLRRNITDFGYYIYSQPIAQQAQSERDERKAPLIQIAVKEAGAIHSSDVTVVVEA